MDSLAWGGESPMRRVPGGSWHLRSRRDCTIAWRRHHALGFNDW